MASDQRVQSARRPGDRVNIGEVVRSQLCLTRANCLRGLQLCSRGISAKIHLPLPVQLPVPQPKPGLLFRLAQALLQGVKMLRLFPPIPQEPT